MAVITRSERALLKELRPYKVSSLANGHLRVEPAWPRSHGFLARMTLADIVARVLNAEGERRSVDRRRTRA